MEFPRFDNIRKITVGDLKDGMSYVVGGYQRRGKIKVHEIVPFNSLMYHTQDEVMMLSVMVEDSTTEEVYKWFDISLKDISKIEYFESS